MESEEKTKTESETSKETAEETGEETVEETVEETAEESAEEEKSEEDMWAEAFADQDSTEAVAEAVAEEAAEEAAEEETAEEAAEEDEDEDYEEDEEEEARIKIGPISVPATPTGKLMLAGGVLGLLVTAGGAYFAWQTFAPPELTEIAKPETEVPEGLTPKPDKEQAPAVPEEKSAKAETKPQEPEKSAKNGRGT